MDLQLDRFLIFLLIILFSLADLFFRWLKKRDARRSSANAREPEREPERSEREMPSPLESEWWPPEPGPPPVPERLPLAPPAEAPRAFAAPLPAALERRPTVRAARRRAWLTHRDARRAIVLMTVLGPCRSLEFERRQP